MQRVINYLISLCCETMGLDFDILRVGNVRWLNVISIMPMSVYS